MAAGAARRLTWHGIGTGCPIQVNYRLEIQTQFDYLAPYYGSHFEHRREMSNGTPPVNIFGGAGLHSTRRRHSAEPRSPSAVASHSKTNRRVSSKSTCFSEDGHSSRRWPPSAPRRKSHKFQDLEPEAFRIK
jgi:hypothetical protein